MTRVRITLRDSRDAPEDKRLAKAAKWFRGAWGWVSEGIVPLSDNPETPRALAERMVHVIEGEDGWEFWWVTETGSRLYCLDWVELLDEVPGRLPYWQEIVARILERGARLYRSGEMEIKI
jgi:hypothetical protein